jgi:hypothetical protein
LVVVHADDADVVRYGQSGLVAAFQDRPAAVVIAGQ